MGISEHLGKCLLKNPPNCYFNNLKQETVSATDAWSLALFFLLLAGWIKDCLYHPCRLISLLTISPLFAKRVKNTTSEVKHLSWKCKTRSKSLSWPKHNPRTRQKYWISNFLAVVCCLFSVPWNHWLCWPWVSGLWAPAEKDLPLLFYHGSPKAAVCCLLLRGFLIQHSYAIRQLSQHTNC